MCTVQSKGQSKLCTLQIISIHHLFCINKRLWVSGPLCHCLVLIAQTESAIDNIYIIYETLCTPFSPSFSTLRQEAAIHSASLVYLHYVDPHTILPLLFIKNSRLYHRFKKIVASSVCCICVSPCVLMSVIARQTFSIGWFLHYARLK